MKRKVAGRGFTRFPHFVLPVDGTLEWWKPITTYLAGKERVGSFGRYSNTKDFSVPMAKTVI